MSLDAQDVTVETTTDVETQDHEVETVDAEVKETEDAQADSPETEGKETDEGESDDTPVETVEEKAARLEKETEAKQKAIDRKTAAYHAQQRKLVELQEQIEAFQREAPKEEATAPDIDDYDSYQEYEAAKEKYVTEKVEREIKGKMLQEQQQAEQQRVMQEKLAKRQAQEAEYIKLNPAYSQSAKEVNDFLPTLNAPAAVQEAVLEAVYAGNVPEIIDYFGANNGERLEELSRISQLSPAMAAIEVYKLRQNIKAPVKKETKTAPKPVARVKGTSAPKDLAKGDVLKNLGLK